MTVVARRIIATPVRSASDAWAVIVGLLAPQSGSEAYQELLAVGGIACSLITDETLRDVPAVVYGSGPRVRLYCLYDDEACTGENASEASLTFDATAGEWQMSLPCHADDLVWVQEALKKRSTHVSARDMTTAVEAEQSGPACAFEQRITVLSNVLFRNTLDSGSCEYQ
jgi:hypothetical protein